MAAVNMSQDERGAVYVEFLLAFLPIFLLFLAICQASFLVAGRLVVNHAALAGARSAIVVLEDNPQHYDDAERGWLSDKPAPKPNKGPLVVMADALLGGTVSSSTSSSSPPTPNPKKPPQQGARMQAIRGAALRPLTTIAPTADAFFGGAGATLQASLTGDATARAFARVYVEAAAVVTVHDSPKREELAAEPVGRNAPVTVRVTFLQMCGIPVVRALMCRSLSSLLDAPARAHDDKSKHETLRERLLHSGMPGWLEASVTTGARFVAYEAQVTLPNQGAAYDYAPQSDDQDEQDDQFPSL